MNKNISPELNSILVRGQRGIVHLFLVLVIVILGIGGLLYYSWQKGLIRTNIQEVISPTPTPDKTADWKTYSGKVYFKYPESWMLNTELENRDFNSFLTLKKGWAKIEIGINLEGFDTSISNYEGSEIIIDGENLYKYKTKDYFGNPKIGISNKLQASIGLVEINNILYSIFLTYPTSIESFQNDTPEQLEGEFNQILSTFEFTDNSKSDREQIEEVVNDYLVLRGSKRDQVKITQVVHLGTYKDKYSVGYSTGENYVGEGLYLLIGKLNDEWVIPESGDSTYCKWIENAGLDEATMAFMGPACDFKY